MSAHDRYILVVSHATQQATLEAAVEVCQQIQSQGAVPVIRELELSAVLELAPELTSLKVLEKNVPVTEIECAIVVGGDGTILRAAELLRGTSVPMLGVSTE